MLIILSWTGIGISVMLSIMLASAVGISNLVVVLPKVLAAVLFFFLCQNNFIIILTRENVIYLAVIIERNKTQI